MIKRIIPFCIFFASFEIFCASFLFLSNTFHLSAYAYGVSLHNLSSSRQQGFGYCGGMPSAGQTLTKGDKQKASKILKSENTDSIKNNCMDCHTMVSLVSSMSHKDRKTWFKGIKYLRKVIEKMKK